MGISKTSEVSKVSSSVQETPSMSGFNDVKYNGIPIDLYGYFDVPLTSNDRQLPERLSKIMSWTNDKETIGDKLQKLRQLENKLGVPRGGESRIERLYRWISLANKMEDLRQRQDALSNRRF